MKTTTTPGPFTVRFTAHITTAPIGAERPRPGSAPAGCRFTSTDDEGNVYPVADGWNTGECRHHARGLGFTIEVMHPGPDGWIITWRQPAADLFDVPNLDDLSTEPHDFDTAAHVYGLLAAYADHKARAMRHRLAGDIDAAMSFERAMEETYNRLPQWARW